MGDYCTRCYTRHRTPIKFRNDWMVDLSPETNCKMSPNDPKTTFRFVNCAQGYYGGVMYVPSNKQEHNEATLRVRWKGDGYQRFIVQVYRSGEGIGRSPNQSLTAAEQSSSKIEVNLWDQPICKHSWCWWDLPLEDRYGKLSVSVEFLGNAQVNAPVLELVYLPAVMTKVRVQDGSYSKICKINFDLGDPNDPDASMQ